MTDRSLDDTNLAQLAREQGVTRATIHARVTRGWTEDEIRAGRRGTAKGTRVMKNYSSRYSDELGGFSSEEVAKYNGISQSGLYYRLRNRLEFAVPDKKSSKKNKPVS